MFTNSEPPLPGIKVPWRLVFSPSSSAAFNMALDEAFLISASNKSTLPTLRLYSWSQPSLSLGIAQPTSDVDLVNLNYRNWQIVRRPTGGKAILHTDELTYSVTAPHDDPLVAGSLLESYQRISHALQKTLQVLGVDTSAKKKQKPQNDDSKNEPVCFQTPSDFEITWQGKKLIGSAQARKMGGVLQHGSFPLYGDLSRITQVLAYPSEFERSMAAQKTLAQAATLETAIGRIFTWNEVAKIITQCFASEFGIAFRPSQPTQPELDLASDLVQSKYGSESWNFRF